MGSGGPPHPQGEGITVEQAVDEAIAQTKEILGN